MIGGPSEDDLVLALWEQIDHRPENAAQRNLCLAWDAVLLVNSDGLEKLFEQAPTMDAYAQALDAMGMSRASEIVAQAAAMVPPELREGDDGRRFDFLRSRFEELDRLAGAFYDATPDAAASVLRYVRSHAEDFAGLEAGGGR